MKSNRTNTLILEYDRKYAEEENNQNINPGEGNDPSKSSRLDKFIILKLKEKYNISLSRSAVRRLLEDGRVSLNEFVVRNPSHHITLGDVFKIDMGGDVTKDYSTDFGNDNYVKSSAIRGENIPLDVIYEDEDMAVINKQAGLVVHPGAGVQNNTLVNALVCRYGENLSNIGGADRPGILHRLDRDTTGLMLIAKNNRAHEALKYQLENRILSRVYIAIIWGVMIPGRGSVEGYMKRDSYNRLRMTMGECGRYSKTNYETLEKFGNFTSILQCKLDTGRTHQIRVHMSSRKHPLVGDQLYGGHGRKLAKIYHKIAPVEALFVENFQRQALCSREIAFIHPSSGRKMHFKIELPEDMKNIISILRRLGKIREDEMR